MPIASRLAYFDHAAVAPLPAIAREAVRRWLDQACEQGDTVWATWARRMEEVRATAAALIHAQPAELALVPNTTTGISLVAEGFPGTPGDNVVTLANEFPSNQYPWMNLAARGVETRRVPVEGGIVDLDRWKPPATGGPASCRSAGSAMPPAGGSTCVKWLPCAGVAAACSFSMPSRGWAYFRSMWRTAASIFSRPMGTSGCWVRKGQGCCMYAASISIC
jgi:hypothetical protein